MVAAVSGSIIQISRVIPSTCRIRRRLRAVCRACSRSAMPVSSISSRIFRARRATRSVSRVVASVQSCSAAVVNIVAVTESDGDPRPTRMASAAATDRVPAATASPMRCSHGWVGDIDTASAVRSPTRMLVAASRNVAPVVTRTSSCGVRCPVRCANPRLPSCGAERRAISPAVNARQRSQIAHRPVDVLPPGTG
jgi:hypothetical protein